MTHEDEVTKKKTKQKKRKETMKNKERDNWIGGGGG